MYVNGRQFNRKGVARETQNIQHVETAAQTPHNVRSKLIAKDHCAALYEAWRSRRASLMKLVRSNTGLGQLDIEAAILDELDRREQRLKNNLLVLESRNDDGPTPINGGAMSHRRFGGGMLDVGAGYKRAA
jgi:hypothetical protein